MESTNTTIVETHGLSKRYGSGVLAVDSVDMFRVVASGDALLAPSVTRRLIEEFARRPEPAARTARRLEVLTDRELEVLKQVARGQTNAEIGAHLHVAETTVKTHVAHILDKLDLRDRVQAVILAYEAGRRGPNLAEFEQPSVAWQRRRFVGAGTWPL